MGRAGIVVIISLIIISCTAKTNIQYRNTVRLFSNEKLEIEMHEGSGIINIKNLSNVCINIITDLKTIAFISPGCNFKYRLPKKSKIKFTNLNKEPALISYSIESNKSFKKIISK